MNRPAVLPETYSGEGPFSDWVESIAEVNRWDEAEKLLWLRVRLIGRAQTAFKRLDRQAHQSFKAALKALVQRFEPDSKRGLYAAELGARIKKPNEDLASFGEDLQALADKAYPNLEEAARDVLAVERYLSQLLDPQVAFVVRKEQPKTIAAAVTSTLQAQSCLPPIPSAMGVTQVDTGAVAAVRSMQESISEAVQQLVSRMAKLETQLAAVSSDSRATSFGRARTGFNRRRVQQHQLVTRRVPQVWKGGPLCARMR